MAIAKKTKKPLVVRAVLMSDRADRRAMAAWRRRVVIMIPSNMTDVLARVLVLAGFTLVHRSARGTKITLESASCIMHGPRELDRHRGPSSGGYIGGYTCRARIGFSVFVPRARARALDRPTRRSATRCDARRC